MRTTLGEIATLIQGELIGDKKVLITGFSGIKEARAGEITFLANQKYIPFAEKTKASAIITSRQVELPGKNIIRTDNPSLAFTQVVQLAGGHGLIPVQGIHPTAVVSPKAKIARNVGLGPYVVLEEGCSIGEGSSLYAGCYVGQEAKIGKNCVLYPHVIIREKVQMGDRVIIHSGTVVGSDGFGYVSVEGVHAKIPQVGTVDIEDDVEIGANVTIDRARFDKTFIGRGTKIDNLVQIAHNVSIGENCIIVSQVGISGSVTVGKGAILAGQAGIAGHLTIGEGAIVAAKSGVHKSIPPNTQVFGYPARVQDQALKLNAHLSRIADYVRTIQELKKKVEDLEKKVHGK